MNRFEQYSITQEESREVSLMSVREQVLQAETLHEAIDVSREGFLESRNYRPEMRSVHMNVNDREELCATYSAWLQAIFMHHPEVSIDAEAVEEAVEKTLVGRSTTEVFAAEYGDISAFLRKDVESHLIFLALNNS